MPKLKTTALLTISLPRKMAQQVEAIRKAEHRTRSELVREALRTYFSTAGFPQAKATASELRALERGRRAFARGEFATLKEIANDLDARPRQTSRKGTKKAAAK